MIWEEATASLKENSMGLNSVPSGERIHIGFFGKRNAGKSSLVNKFTNQKLSVVSDVPGTTTDPVKKAMEILPLGPVVIIDTPGFDDEGELGALRVEQTKKVLNECDIAILAIDPEKGITETEKELIALFNEKGTKYIEVFTKADIKKADGLSVSSVTGEGMELLKEKIADLTQKDGEDKRIIGDILNAGDRVILVMPIDESAPKGRIILPQQQVIRDVLEAGAHAVCVRDSEYADTLEKSGDVRLVITDSQVFGKIRKETPESIPLTSFSIVMARYKGTLTDAVSGAKMLSGLKDGDNVLICEACTHKRQCKDIGTVKLPGWICDFTGKKISFSHTQGKDFPEDLTPYKLIIHCGGCMATEHEMAVRLSAAKRQNVPMTNYGTAIAYMNGILKRSLEALPECKK